MRASKPTACITGRPYEHWFESQLLIQPLVHVSGKAAEEGPSAFVHAPTWGNPEEISGSWLPVSSVSVIATSGEGTSEWKISVSPHLFLSLILP